MKPQRKRLHFSVGGDGGNIEEKMLPRPTGGDHGRCRRRVSARRDTATVVGRESADYLLSHLRCMARRRERERERERERGTPRREEEDGRVIERENDTLHMY